MTALNGPGGRVEAAEIPDPAIPDIAGLAGRTRELIDSIAAELRAAIALEQAGRAEYEQAVNESKERERQLTRTLATLEHTPTKPGPKPAAAKPKSRPKVSDASLERIWQAFSAWSAGPDGHPVSAHAFTEIMREQGTGMGMDTVLSAFRTLRERELMRPAGKGRTGGTLWAPMPGVTDGS